MTGPDLRTVAGVELVRCGTWELSTGPWTVAPDDLASAVTAHQAGVVRSPVVKIGHVDPRFDGEPAVGRVDRLRVVDNGTVLLGDLIGLPAWLADGVLASAYPDRSVEGELDFVDASGTTWPFVLSAVALLGVTAPGVSSLRSLADVGALYGVAASRGARTVALRLTHPPGADPAVHRRVAVRAAAARRRHRRAAILLAAIDAATTTL